MTTEMTKAVSDILERGRVAQKKTIDGIFEFADCVADLKASPDCKHGDFTKLCLHEWNIKPQVASYFMAVHKNKIILQYNFESLPIEANVHAIAILGSLSEKEFKQGIEEGVIHPAATQPAIQAFKKNPYGHQQAKLKKLISTLLKKKKVADDIKEAMLGETAVTIIKDVGYKVCVDNIVELHKMADEFTPKVKPTPKDKPKPKPEPFKRKTKLPLPGDISAANWKGIRDKLTKAELREVYQHIKAKVAKQVQDAQNDIAIRERLLKEEKYCGIDKVLSVKDVKVIKQALHPDRNGDTTKAFALFNKAFPKK